jgi:hypothetical protein
LVGGEAASQPTSISNSIKALSLVAKGELSESDLTEGKSDIIYRTLIIFEVIHFLFFQDVKKRPQAHLFFRTFVTGCFSAFINVSAFGSSDNSARKLDCRK